MRKRDKCFLALKEYGTTDDFYETGYIMPDGKKLNFKGECNSHSRCIEHRDVGRLVLKDRDPDEHWSEHNGISRFQELCGGIRFSKIGDRDPYVYVDIQKKPTEKQQIELRKAVRDARATMIERKDKDDRYVCSLEVDYPLPSSVDRFVDKCFS